MISFVTMCVYMLKNFLEEFMRNLIGLTTKVLKEGRDGEGNFYFSHYSLCSWISKQNKTMTMVSLNLKLANVVTQFFLQECS